jgi:ABC-2 type transport system permease protein
MEDAKPSFSKGRKWRIGFHVVVATLSAFALVVMANYLAARHSIRFDWSNAGANKLSASTLRALNSLTNTVKVIVFFDRNEPLFGQVSSMIKDYQLHCAKLDVEFIDYRYPGRAEVIRRQYESTSPGDASRVIFDYNGRVRSVMGGELSDFGIGADKEIRRTAFKGEQLFTSAILSVTAPRKTRAYFVTGHGEHDPQSTDDSEGYNRFAKMLVNNDVDLGVADLHSHDVPDDCGLLIIAGPKNRFDLDELDRLERYLSQGGRLLALFRWYAGGDPLTGLESRLLNWNVQIGLNYVVDKDQSSAANKWELVARPNGAHPITKPLFRSSIEMIMPRSVSARPGGVRADAPRATELISTGERGMAVHPEGNQTGSVERVGAIPIAVAVEKGGIQGVASDRGATRIVVLGSSMTFGNAVIQAGANADLANLAVNWLLSRDVRLTDIPPRAITEYRINVTKKQMATLRWIFLAAAPGGALLLGGIVWIRRRK